MRTSLTRDEAICVEYLRHCRCHVFQEDYLWDRKTRKPRTKKRVATLGEEVPIDEIAWVTDANTREYLRRESEFARKVAVKVHPDSGLLVQLLTGMSGPAEALLADLIQRGVIERPPT